jgi:tyrosyl-tRNA synthetase
VQANAETYAQQAFKVLDPEKTHIMYNADWLAKVDFAQLIHLASNFTIQQFLTRENFKLRFDKNEAIYVHEFFYALMQAYDAYHLKADVQIGGTDQLFNIITAGRKLMTALDVKPNIGIIMAILPGTDGEIKMSKSLGNHIPLNSNAIDMYGKVMSVPDSAMPLYYKLVTRWDAVEVESRLARIKSGEVHPRDAKMAVAYEITEIFYGFEDAKNAQEEFIRVFQKGDVPDEMGEFKFDKGQTVLDVMEAAGLIESRGEGRRLLTQNGVSLDGEKLTEPNAAFPGEGVLRVGKRRFVKIVK